MKPVRFADIKQYTREANYSVTVGWNYLEEHIANQTDQESAPLDLEPDFQRAHVWDDERRARYVEFILRGGVGQRDLLLNCAGWMQDWRGPYVIVDGKQRLEAARKFMRNELPITLPELSKKPVFFGDFKDGLRFVRVYFNWKVNDLPTRAQVLRWYLEMNTGGVPHTPEELARVQALLDVESRKLPRGSKKNQ